MTESSFEIRCPKCTGSIMTTVDQAGDTISCPRCQNRLLVPGRKSKSQNVDVDDLLDMDDDVLVANPAGEEIVAEAIDDPAGDDELNLAAGPDKSGVAADVSKRPPPATAEPDETVPPGEELDDLLLAPEPTPRIEAHRDPFEVDENANLVVEGVTPQDNQFPVDCHLCGTLLYARVSQVGTKIKCPDCYSLVEVHPPRETPKPVEHEPPARDEGGGYRLSDPVELEPIDTTIDITLGDIDYDDDEFFEKRRGRQRQELDIAVSVQPEDAADDVAGARNVGGDSGKPGGAGGNSGSSRPEGDTSQPKPRFRLPPGFEEKKTGAGKTGTPGSGPDVPVHVEPEKTTPGEPLTPGEPSASDRKKKASRARATREPASEVEDIPGVFANFGAWLSKCCTPLRNVDCLLRLAVAALVVGICYLIIFAGMGFFTEESTRIQQFAGFLLVGVGGILLTLTAFFVGVVANPIIQVAMNQQEKLSEWPDFSLADWFAKFVYIGTSFWLAAFPGVIGGGFLALVFRSAVWLPCCIVISSLTLAPFFLASVVFNESPWQPVSARVFRSFQPLRNRWIRFLIAAPTIGLLVCALFPVASFGLVAFVAAALQLALLFIYYWMLGDLTGQILQWVVGETTD